VHPPLMRHRHRVRHGGGHARSSATAKRRLRPGYLRVPRFYYHLTFKELTVITSALDQLVQAIEAGLKLNPELLDQSDSTKTAYWRDMLCPALQAAKEAKGEAITLREMSLMFKLIQRMHGHAIMAQKMSDVMQLPPDMVEMYTEDMDAMEPLMNRIAALIDKAAVETLIT
jgi:hypothetical protein